MHARTHTFLFLWALLGEMFSSLPMAFFQTSPLTPGGSPFHHSSWTLRVWWLQNMCVCVVCDGERGKQNLKSQLCELAMRHQPATHSVSQLGSILPHSFSDSPTVLSFCLLCCSLRTSSFALCSSVEQHTQKTVKHSDPHVVGWVTFPSHYWPHSTITKVDIKWHNYVKSA